MGVFCNSLYNKKELQLYSIANIKSRQLCSVVLCEVLQATRCEVWCSQKAVITGFVHWGMRTCSSAPLNRCMVQSFLTPCNNPHASYSWTQQSPATFPSCSGMEDRGSLSGRALGYVSRHNDQTDTLHTSTASRRNQQPLKELEGRSVIALCLPG